MHNLSLSVPNSIGKLLGAATAPTLSALAAVADTDFGAFPDLTRFPRV